jgi:hypothetical protein
VANKYIKKHSTSLATNQSDIEISLQSECLSLRKQTITISTGKNTVERNPYTVGIKISADTMEFSLEVLHKTKSRLTI